MRFLMTILSAFALLTSPVLADAFDGATIVNIEKHQGNYANCSGRSSDEYVWIRFKKSTGNLTGYYRVDINPSTTYNSLLLMAMTAMTTGIKVNVRTEDDGWCQNPGYIRALNFTAD